MPSDVGKAQYLAAVVLAQHFRRARIDTRCRYWRYTRERRGCGTTSHVTSVVDMGDQGWFVCVENVEDEILFSRKGPVTIPLPQKFNGIS